MFHRHIRRTYVPDGVYFVITDVRCHAPFFANQEVAQILENTIWWSRKIHRCILYAYVIMPDHLHILVEPTLTNISQVMHAIKINSSRDIHKHTHSRGINTSAMGWFQWQQSFYDHIIKDDQDLHNNIEYIRYNPVKAGLVENPEDYPFLFVDEGAVSRVLSL